MNTINDNLNILNLINDNSFIETNRFDKADESKKIDDKIHSINNNNKIFLNNEIYNISKTKNVNNIQYGIDENGNPINIYEYYNNCNNDKKPRLIAYITKEKNRNELMDLNGNKIVKKNKEGDYEFPFQLNILVKDFDVQHPELRTKGESSYKKYLKENNNNNIESNKKILFPINSMYAYNNINSKNYFRKKFITEKNELDDSNYKRPMKIRYNHSYFDGNITFYNNKDISYKNENRIKKAKMRYAQLNGINSLTPKNIKKDQEIITRTNSILNMKRNENRIDYVPKTINDYKKKYYYNNSVNPNKKKIPINCNYAYKKNFVTPTIITNSISNDNTDIINTSKYVDYSIHLDTVSSPYFKNNLINQKLNKTTYNNITNNNSQYSETSHYNKSLSDDIKKNNSSHKSNDEKLIYNDINNTINNIININNSKYNYKKLIKGKRKGQIIDKCLTNNLDNKDNKIEKYLKKDTPTTKNIKENKPQKMINKKLSLNKIIKHSIRKTDSSKKNFINCYKESKNKNELNLNIPKKMKKIDKIIPKNIPKRKKYSILTNEASNMIKNYSAKKKNSKSRNIERKKKIEINTSSNRYISSPLIIQGYNNKSFH